MYLLSATQDSKARDHATSLGHVTCHRVSLVATPSYGSLAVTKQKHFSIAKTGPEDYRQVLGTILDELLDWKDKKELQLGLIYRYARNKSGVIEKESAATKTVPAIISHSGRTLGSRSMSLIDIPTISNPTGRLLNAQAVEDENNPALAVRPNIQARWRCHRKDCDSQNYPEPVCYIDFAKDAQKHYPVTPPDVASWAAAIQEDRTGRLTLERPPTSQLIDWDRKLKIKQKTMLRKKQEEDKDIQLTRDRVPAPTATPATTIIRLPTPSTSSTGALSDIRSSRLEAELASSRQYADSHRSVSRAYSRGVTSVPEQEMR